MPSVINTNLPSLNAQRNLNTSQSSLATSLQRLSSGLRVNSAKDDAAGLAIAERMNAQVRGLNVAARNANDGVSLAQTAEGALGKIGDMVQRIRELAVQSSNATNSAEDRLALQQEVQQLKQEIDRVASSSNFNGTKLLDGSFAAAAFQVGANAGESITVDGIADAKLSGMTIEHASVASTASTTITNLAPITGADLTINGAGIVLTSTVTSARERQAELANAINNAATVPKVNAFIDTATDTIVLTSLGPVDVTAADATLGFTTAITGTGPVAMSDLDIKNYAGAQLAIQQADGALNQINGARAKLGAVQSRFENAVSNIQIAAENTTAARSRIIDADFAAETAAMTRAQILQQAGTAMLSQANQIPQQVLSLLK